MRAFPPVPDVADAPASLLDGHLWLQEYVEGGPLRFQLRESGLLVFGDAERVFGNGEAPLDYRAAVRYVREQFERDVLRAALDDVNSAVFYGVATRRGRLDYDWSTLPAFLGFDVYHARDDRFLPPDAVERLYDRLGLAALNAVQKEVRGTDFEPKGYSIPTSAWRDGRAAGVLVRNKTGDRAKLLAAQDDGPPDDQLAGDAAAVASDAPAAPSSDAPTDLASVGPTELASDLVTDARVRRARDAVTTGGVDAVTDRVLELLAREEYATLFGDDASIDVDAFRSAVGEQTRRRLDVA